MCSLINKYKSFWRNGHPSHLCALSAMFLILAPNTVLADKTQGTYFCEEIHTDGSRGRFLIDVEKKALVQRYLDWELVINWHEVYQSTNEFKQYSVYAMSQNSAQGITILTPTDKANILTITSLDMESWYERTLVAHGSCTKASHKTQ